METNCNGGCYEQCYDGKPGKYMKWIKIKDCPCRIFGCSNCGELTPQWVKDCYQGYCSKCGPKLYSQAQL